MAWSGTEEGLPDGATAASKVDNNLREWWVRIRKFLALWVTDTSDTLLGQGADENNPKIREGCVTAAAIPNDVLDSQHYAAGSFHYADMANSVVGANHLGDAASFKNAQTRYVSVPFCGNAWVGSAGAVEAWGSKLNFVNSQSDAYYVAVYLPHGAIVTLLYSYCKTLTEGSITVCLCRSDNDSTTRRTLVEVEHISTGALTEGDIDYETIDNTAYCYFLRIVADNSETSGQLTGVIISYTVARLLR